jgi:vacuolar-type H+-ATPase subunit H
MESNQRYWARRAVEEHRAAERAITPEARARRRALAEAFEQKAQTSGDEIVRSLVLS